MKRRRATPKRECNEGAEKRKNLLSANPLNRANSDPFVGSFKKMKAPEKRRKRIGKERIKKDVRYYF